MKKTSLFIADSDEAYLSAVTNYLLRSRKNLSVSACSDSAHLPVEQSFDILLTSPDMAKAALERVSAKRTVYLLSSGEMAPEDAEAVYRFQPMDVFVERLLKIDTSQETPGGPRLLGVVSPIHHELSLPFSLALAKICSEEERTLFIDLTEASIMPELFSDKASFEDREDMYPDDEENIQPYENGPDLLDVIYDIESTGIKRVSERFIKKCGGFSYLPSARDPELLSEVTKPQWLHFMDAVSHSGFDCVVILSDRLPGHFVEWKGRRGEVIMLSKDGDYYRKSVRRYEDYLSERLPEVRKKIISLPMSAANLSDGTWYLESLIEGNLGKFVREKVASAG
ncbi:MAG: hypothetical protein IJJ79_04190 [Lachnospiraceae bacterium]|nr:hypothetical protein [Lachnospiraceae bacterium]